MFCKILLSLKRRSSIELTHIFHAVTIVFIMIPNIAIFLKEKFKSVIDYIIIIIVIIKGELNLQ